MNQDELLLPYKRHDDERPTSKADAEHIIFAAPKPLSVGGESLSVPTTKSSPRMKGGAAAAAAAIGSRTNDTAPITTLEQRQSMNKLRASSSSSVETWYHHPPRDNVGTILSNKLEAHGQKQLQQYYEEAKAYYPDLVAAAATRNNNDDTLMAAAKMIEMATITSPHHHHHHHHRVMMHNRNYNHAAPASSFFGDMMGQQQQIPINNLQFSVNDRLNEQQQVASSISCRDHHHHHLSGAVVASVQQRVSPNRTSSVDYFRPCFELGGCGGISGSGGGVGGWITGPGTVAARGGGGGGIDSAFGMMGTHHQPIVFSFGAPAVIGGGAPAYSSRSSGDNSRPNMTQIFATSRQQQQQQQHVNGFIASKIQRLSTHQLLQALHMKSRAAAAAGQAVAIAQQAEGRGGRTISEGCVTIAGIHNGIMNTDICGGQGAMRAMERRLHEHQRENVSLKMWARPEQTKDVFEEPSTAVALMEGGMREDHFIHLSKVSQVSTATAALTTNTITNDHQEQPQDPPTTALTTNTITNDHQEQPQDPPTSALTTNTVINDHQEQPQDPPTTALTNNTVTNDHQEQPQDPPTTALTTNTITNDHQEQPQDPPTTALTTNTITNDHQEQPQDPPTSTLTTNTVINDHQELPQDPPTTALTTNTITNDHQEQPQDPPTALEQTISWTCDNCQNIITSTKKEKARCGKCYRWKGGKRKGGWKINADKEIDRAQEWTCCDAVLSGRKTRCGKCRRWRGGKRVKTLQQTDQLRVGEVVYAARWKTKKRDQRYTMFRGTVKAVKHESSTSYDIEFDDGKCLAGIDKSFVIAEHRYLHGNIKPRLKNGQRVVAAWWESALDTSSPPVGWFPGVVKGCRQLKQGGKFGPDRFYDIKFDDGDELDDIEDIFVVQESEYELLGREARNEISGWKGVRNVLDEDSFDRYASTVGYWVVNGNENKPFPFLGDALRYYDDHIVSCRGANIKKVDLNLPEEWVFDQEAKFPPVRSLARSVNNDTCRPTEEMFAQISRYDISNGEPEREASSKTTRPPPTKLIPSGLVCLRGNLVQETRGNVAIHRISGRWSSMGLAKILADPENKLGLCSDFEYEHKKESSGGESSTAKAFPLSGSYSGSFMINKAGVKTTEVEQDVIFNFVENNEGYHNVEGSGSNSFGKYTTSGTLTKEGVITIYHHYPLVVAQSTKVKKETVPQGKPLPTKLEKVASITKDATPEGGSESDQDSCATAKRVVLIDARSSSAEEQGLSEAISDLLVEAKQIIQQGGGENEHDNGIGLDTDQLDIRTGRSLQKFVEENTKQKKRLKGRQPLGGQIAPTPPLHVPKETSHSAPSKRTLNPPISKAFSYPTMSITESRFMAEEASEFPDGWLVREVPRTKGNHRDRYYYSPELEIRFRSKVEVRRFLDCLVQHHGDEEKAWLSMAGNRGKRKAETNRPCTDAAVNTSSTTTSSTEDAPTSRCPQRKRKVVKQIQPSKHICKPKEEARKEDEHINDVEISKASVNRARRSSISSTEGAPTSRCPQRNIKVVEYVQPSKPSFELNEEARRSVEDINGTTIAKLPMDQTLSCNKYIKPTFHRGEKVYAVWRGADPPSVGTEWFPGRIWDFKVKLETSYGPVKTYDVIFDDGNVETSLDEILVMKKEDYEVLSTKPEVSSWIGVRKYFDRSSNDEYAKNVGWYEMCCGGEHQIYTSLSHALKSYDKHIISLRGRDNVLDEELNFPSDSHSSQT